MATQNNKNNKNWEPCLRLDSTVVLNRVTYTQLRGDTKSQRQRRKKKIRNDYCHVSIFILFIFNLLLKSLNFSFFFFLICQLKL